MQQENRNEREYRAALDALRFSDAGKERIMNKLTQKNGQSAGKRRAFRPLRAGLIAACLCLVLVGTAGAVQFFGVRIDLQSNPDYPGDNYTVTGGIAFFPADSFPQQVHDMAVLHEMTGKNFKSWAQMEEFLGRELPNSTALESAQSGPVVKVSGSEKGTHILLKVYAVDQGLVLVGAEGHYVLDGIWIKQSAVIYTDKMEENYKEYGLEGEEFDGGVTMLYEKGSVMTEETYTTPNGLTATIVGVMPPPDSDCLIAEYNAHFSIDGMQYRIGASTYAVGMTAVDVAAADDPAHTLEVLKRVLDGFTV